MERLKKYGRFRLFMSKYNNYFVWVFCGVLAIAQIDFIYKSVTGQRPKSEFVDFVTFSISFFFF